MRSFYVRVVVTTFAVMIVSSLLAFFVSNLYYQLYLKPVNDAAITEMAEEVKAYAENTPLSDEDAYFSHIGNLGYQLVIINEEGEKTSYGHAFRETSLRASTVEDVFAGNTYHGVAAQPAGLFMTGFFNNILENTIGLPLETEEGTAALFIRPDHEQQLGEFRTFLAIVLTLTILFSFLFVALSGRRIVKPVISLTDATKKLADGSFDIELNVKRKDEIGQLARHFTMMSKDLRQLEAMRQEFVSNVSHEIQSPLSTIRGITQTIQQSNLDEAQKEKYMEIIEKESGRLSTLSGQLLTLASLDNEDRLTGVKKVDIVEQIKDAVQTLAFQWQEKELYVEIEGEPQFVNGDASLLHQVWINVLTNAIKYNEVGGNIYIRVSREGSTVVISIEDTGIGMESSVRRKVFRRFFQEDRARTSSTSGTGLGLSIVKKIVDLHQGTIEIESEPQKGTRVSIYFPWSKDDRPH